MTVPTKFSGTSMERCSTGSMTWSSMRFVTISGRLTISSKPSRRIISIRMPSCSSPRPSTLKESGEPVSCILSETLVSSSLSRRSRRLREVTNLPSRPANGPLLTLNWIAIVGSSIVIGGSGCGFSTSQKLSPIVMPGMPAMATISPIWVSSMSVRLRPEKLKSFVILYLAEGAVELGDVVLLAGAHGAVEDTANGETTEVVGVVEVGDKDLDGAVGIALGDRDRLDDLLEERLKIGAGDGGVRGGGAELAVGVENREVEHGLVGVEVDEEVIDLVEDLLRARVGTVDLVDHDHRGEAGFERLGENVTGLRQRAFGGVDEEDDAVDHLEGALHFTAEVGVAGGVDDVDLVVVIVEGGVLGENRDAALFFKVVRVHDALGDGLVGAEGAALAQHGVDEGGLAMVDVGDDGDVEDGLNGDCG